MTPTERGWLDRHSGKPGKAPRMGARAGDYAPLCAAPGSYVLAE